MDGTEKNRNGMTEYLPRLEKLLELAEAGHEQAFMAHLDDLTSIREQSLFKDVGRLTRQLHESLMSFQFDSRVAALAASEFPDARNRLDHVIELTEQSAHRTMDLVEAAVPVVDELHAQAEALAGQWRDSTAVSSSLAEETAEFMGSASAQAGTLRRALSDVLIAQNFQDLSGQIIRDIIGLVKEVEETLVNMIRLSGRSADLVEHQSAKNRRQQDTDRARNQDDVDDILSNLGF